MRALINDPPVIPRPTVADILAAVARLRAPSTAELARLLWPGLPWLPPAPGADSARLTPYRWRCDPPLPDGRVVWDAPCGDWLWCELEALVKARKLERAAEGDARGVDAVATARYRLGVEAVQHPPRKRGVQGRCRRG